MTQECVRIFTNRWELIIASSALSTYIRGGLCINFQWIGYEHVDGAELRLGAVWVNSS